MMGSSAGLGPGPCIVLGLGSSTCLGAVAMKCDFCFSPFSAFACTGRERLRIPNQAAQTPRRNGQPRASGL